MFPLQSTPICVILFLNLGGGGNLRSCKSNGITDVAAFFLGLTSLAGEFRWVTP